MLVALLTCLLLFFALRGAVLLLLILWRRRPDTAAGDRVPLRKRSALGTAAGAAVAAGATAAGGSTARPIRTLVVLGSGGHTAEMLAVLSSVPRASFAPLLFVRAATDSGSEARARRAEQERGNQHQAAHRAIYRSREVGQSYVTSVISTARALLESLRVVFVFRPELLLCNGPGTCVPLCFAAFLFRLLLFRPCSIVFVESFCRVRSLSLSGLLLYPLVDEFVVQWPQLAAEQPQHQSQHQQHAARQVATGETAAARDTSNVVGSGGHSARPRQLTEQEEQELAARAKGAAACLPSATSSLRGWRYAKYIGRLC